ncbi:MAG: PAS domain S-box protein, partial [Acidobacteria bacterium]|nr:PAS domain S-box protein [Acidobacteriota bacterium]
IFLDRALRVKRYTPRVAEVFNILPSDIGRPLEHLTHKLDYDHLTEDAGEALRTLHLKEREVRGGAGDNRYLVRLAPYRMLDDKIDGVVLSFQDITDLKRADDLLQESEKRLDRESRIFYTTLSSITDFAYTFDREGRFIFANKSLLDLWGLKLEDAAGKNFYDLNYPDDLAARLQRQIQQVFDTKQIVKDETPYASPTGANGYYEYIFNPVFANDGTVEVVTGSTRDITERKRAEERLKQSEEWLRTIFEASREGILVEDNERINYINKSYVQMLGYDDSAELIGQPTSVIISPEDAGRILEFGRSRLRGAEPPSNYEFKAKRKDGTLVEVETSVSTSNIAGKIYITTMIRDITERKRAEEALRESEEKYRNLFNSIDEGFCTVEVIFDADEKPVDYRFLESNPMFEQLTGLENAAGKTALELIPNLESKWVEIYGKVALTGESVRFEDNSEPMNRWFDVFASRVGDAASHRVAIICTNITERKRMEQTLRHAKDELEDRVKERTIELMEANANLEAEAARRLKAEVERAMLLRRVIFAQEDERRRIAREMHDQFGQQLTALTLKLSTLKEGVPEQPGLYEQIEGLE